MLPGRWWWRSGLAFVLALCSCSPAKRSAGPMSQDVYVWQRAWTEPVRAATRLRGTNFTEVIALHAEVGWKAGRPVVTRVPLDFGTLGRSGARVGLALRVGEFGGPFSGTNQPGRFLITLAQSLLEEARTNRCEVAELQLDFDAAEAKLDGYRVWVEAIRAAIKPAPLTITTLPSWLKRPAFEKLVRATDGFVLQVHSLARPRSADAPFELCDPRAAVAAVERAARFGVPFRVALPTYGYLLAFSPEGRFAGLSAEGPSASWRPGTRVREVRAEPERMAGLVRQWSLDRPDLLKGIIWYRLPVAGDKLNWSWPALASVMAGNDPRPRLRPEARYPQPGLVEVDLVNSGSGDYDGPARVNLKWKAGKLVASDGWQGFEIVETPGVGVSFQGKSTRLPAGERRPVGWLRVDRETEVSVEYEAK